MELVGRTCETQHGIRINSSMLQDIFVFISESIHKHRLRKCLTWKTPGYKAGPEIRQDKNERVNWST